MIWWMLAMLYFMLPAYVANMMPVLVKNVCFLDIPIDAHKVFRGHRLLGSHKTWRGVVFGVIGALLTILLQQYLMRFTFFAQISLLNYHEPPVVIGFLLGLGALTGDAVKSFFKRRMYVPAGKSWFPFDQTDYVIGALIFCAPVYFVGWSGALFLVLSSLILHPAANYAGYLLHLKKNKF